MSRNAEFLGGLRYETYQAESSRQMHHVVRAYAPGREQPVGRMYWSQTSGNIDLIGVDKEFRRQGLATEMLHRGRQFAAERGLVGPQHDPERTEEGQAWAQSLGERLPAWKNLGPSND